MGSITLEQLKEAGEFLRETAKPKGDYSFWHNGKVYDTGNLSEEDAKELEPLFEDKVN